jgi:DNA polymerase sigma
VNTSTLGQLLRQFFAYYAVEFRMDSHVVCVRIGAPHQDKPSVWAGRAVKYKPNMLSVEDPFNHLHDLGVWVSCVLCVLCVLCVYATFVLCA